jgi:hypothetical protein
LPLHALKAIKIKIHFLLKRHPVEFVCTTQ